MLLVIVLAIAGTLLLVPAFFIILFLGWTPTSSAGSAVDDERGLQAPPEHANDARSHQAARSVPR